MHEGDTYLDRDGLADLYLARRHRPDSPNEAIEKPITWDLVGDVRGQHVLDLGCGDGSFGVELLNAGCVTYTGLESSAKMAQRARELLQHAQGKIALTRIEDWDFPVDAFDLVVSRLALHYVADLHHTFLNVSQALRHGGRFVFSMVHPVITSSDKSREASGVRGDWIVDDYFATGPRKVRFMDDFVVQYHRTVEDLFTSLKATGFAVEQLREARPTRGNFDDVGEYQRRSRIPLFIFFSARKG